MTAVLDMVVSPGDRTLFGFSLQGIGVRATDLPWSAGTGVQLAGPSRDLLMLLADRAVPRDRLAADAMAGRR